MKTLLEQAELAPLKRKLVARPLFTLCLLFVAFSIGGIMSGYGVVDSMFWAITYALALRGMRNRFGNR